MPNTFGGYGQPQPQQPQAAAPQGFNPTGIDFNSPIAQLGVEGARTLLGNNVAQVETVPSFVLLIPS